jgi:hypothetical protein
MLALTGLLTSSALASGSPIITNEAATDYTLNTVTLHAKIDPNGGVGTSYGVEYGKTKLYGSTISSGLLGGKEAKSVSIRVVGLEPLSTYHYRILAGNSLGNTYGEDQTFEMLKSWKVEGQPLGSIGHPVTYSEDLFARLEMRKTIAGQLWQVDCYADRSGDFGTGTLGVTYGSPKFEDCTTRKGGNGYEACKPTNSSVTVQVNSLFVVTSPTKVQFDSAKCPELSPGYILIDTGNGFGALTENGKEEVGQRMNIRTTATGWEVNWHNASSWYLSGVDTGKVFGIN